MKKTSPHILAAACIAAALYAPLGVADTVAQNVTEARQETQIWTTYGFNPHLRALDLKVSVKSGRATLSGKVGEGIEKSLAEQIALGVDGIKSVDNQIAVESGFVPAERASKGRSFRQVVEDANITASVKSKLLWSRYAEGLATDVDTTSGAVTLTGTAESTAARDLAGRLAGNTSGVLSVSNKLVVAAKPSATPTQGNPMNMKSLLCTALMSGFALGAVGCAHHGHERSGTEVVSDSSISTKVKAALLAEKDVKSFDISVKTFDGVVQLSGFVDSQWQIDKAVQVANAIHGVKSVRNDLIHKPKS